MLRGAGWIEAIVASFSTSVTLLVVTFELTYDSMKDQDPRAAK